MALGLGLAIGPVIGSFAYSLMNYVNTFYFFTGYILFIGMTCVTCVPSRINQSQAKSQDGGEAGVNPYANDVTYFKIL